MSEWKETILGDLIDIKHGWAFKGEFFKETTHPKNIIVAIGNFDYSGGFRFDSTRTKEYLDSYPQEYELTPGDILLAMTCQTAGGEILGIPGRIPTDSRIYLHNQRLGKVEIKDEKITDSSFIYWLCLWQTFNQHLVATATGTKILHTAPERIKSFTFKCPRIDEQKQIGKTLDALDRKISNLRQQNETLEQIAQTLFKHWFVDFEFPNEDGKPYRSSGGEMVRSELGEIPIDWRVGTLGDEFDILMGQSPDGSSYNEDGEGLIFFQGRTDFDFRFPQVRLFTTEPKRIANKFDVLVSVRAPVGDINVAFERCCIGRGLSAVSSAYKSYCLYKLKSYRKFFDVFEFEGTVFGSLNKQNFNDLESVIPNKETLETFDSIVSPLDRKVFVNEQEIQTLTKTRDVLLPKLMSGKLRITE